MSSLKSSSDEKQRLGIVFESIARGSIVDAGPERISDAIICWIRFARGQRQSSEEFTLAVIAKRYWAKIRGGLKASREMEAFIFDRLALEAWRDGQRPMSAPAEVLEWMMDFAGREVGKEDAADPFGRVLRAFDRFLGGEALGRPAAGRLEVDSKSKDIDGRSRRRLDGIWFKRTRAVLRSEPSAIFDSFGVREDRGHGE
ncbi:hypothetical protein OAR33_00210 [bacterium]|nr:hypothetical protein [bacterium]MDC0991976.1 hypothetical protein [bacterium]